MQLRAAGLPGPALGIGSMRALPCSAGEPQACHKRCKCVRAARRCRQAHLVPPAAPTRSQVAARASLPHCQLPAGPSRHCPRARLQPPALRGCWRCAAPLAAATPCECVSAPSARSNLARCCASWAATPLWATGRWAASMQLWICGSKACRVGLLGWHVRSVLLCALLTQPRYQPASVSPGPAALAQPQPLPAGRWTRRPGWPGRTAMCGRLRCRCRLAPLWSSRRARGFAEGRRAARMRPELIEQPGLQPFLLQKIAAVHRTWGEQPLGRSGQLASLSSKRLVKMHACSPPR